MKDLVVIEGRGDQVPVLAPEDVEAAQGFLDASRAASTRIKYERDWDAFGLWCRERGHQYLPADPAVVAVYLSALAASGLAPMTIGRKLAAIGYMHGRAGETAPHKVRGGQLVLEVLAGVRRTWRKPQAKKAAADADICWSILHEIKGDTLRDVRDRALIAFGFASAMRRSEVVALMLSDVERSSEGLRVAIRRSKTDQEHEGTVIAIPEGKRIRPVARLDAWTQRAGITSGHLFRRLSQDGKRVLAGPMSDRAVARIVQARAAAAGLEVAQFAAHSLRAGFLTSAAGAGATIWKMQEVSRHKSVQVLSGYVRSAKLFEDHAGKGFL